LFQSQDFLIFSADQDAPLLPHPPPPPTPPPPPPLARFVGQSGDVRIGGLFATTRWLTAGASRIRADLAAPLLTSHNPAGLLGERSEGARTTGVLGRVAMSWSDRIVYRGIPLAALLRLAGSLIAATKRRQSRRPDRYVTCTTPPARRLHLDRPATTPGGRGLSVVRLTPWQRDTSHRSTNWPGLFGQGCEFVGVAKRRHRGEVAKLAVEYKIAVRCPRREADRGRRFRGRRNPRGVCTRRQGVLRYRGRIDVLRRQDSRSNQQVNAQRVRDASTT